MRQSIDRASSVPLYSQIKQILINELRSAKDGDAPVLTEASLIKRFHVSRAPIRQALAELVEGGYVVRHRAKGTFPVQGLNVRQPPDLKLGSLTRYLTEQGLNPTSRVTLLERVRAPAAVAEALGLDASTEVLNLERIISATGLPLVWTRTYLCTPSHFRPSIIELEHTGSVFALIERGSRGDLYPWRTTGLGIRRESRGRTRPGHEAWRPDPYFGNDYVYSGRPPGWLAARSSSGGRVQVHLQPQSLKAGPNVFSS